jgi:hypothetical protein
MPNRAPSAKVLTGLIVSILAGVATALATDTTWLDLLPPWAAAVAGPILGAVAAYAKRETNPAPSSLDS